MRWETRTCRADPQDIASAGGSIEFARPVAYQIAADGSRRPVRASYALKSRGGFGFHLGRYDRGRELVIDPTLVYSTYYGGTSYDSGRGMAIDSQGNAYIVGATSSGDLPTTQGSLRPGAPVGLPNTTLSTGYLAKFNSTGTQLIYATYIGGSALNPIGFNQANAVAVDAGFNAFITGSTNSTDFPLKNEVQKTCGPENNIAVFSGCGATLVSACGNTVNGAQEDMFVMKLDPTGSTPFYSTYLGGSDDDEGSGIAVDSTGNANVVGNTLSIASYSSCGSYQSTHQFDDSKAELAGMVALPENVPPDLRLVFDGRPGRQTEASGELQRLIDESRHRYVQPLAIAALAAISGDERQQREWFEIAYRRHDPALVWFSMFPTKNPAIRDIVKRMGLVPREAAAVSSARPRE
jgi:hypothetical protein